MTTIVVPPQCQWGEGESLQSFVDRGVAAANSGADVTVLVRPSRYRASIAIRNSRSGSLTIRGSAGSEGTLLDGTEPLSNDRGGECSDTTSAERTFLYPDPPSLGTDVWASMGKPIGLLGRRRELVFIGDRALRRVSDSPGPGEYSLSTETPLVTYVDFNPEEPDRDVAFPDAEANHVCVSVRETGIEITDSCRVRVTGFTVSGYRSDVAHGAVAVTGSSDVELSEICTRDNNWDGLTVHGSTTVTLRSIWSAANGGSGAVMFRSSSLQIEDVHVHSNNLHAALGNFLDWATAGMKLIDVQGVTVRRFACRESRGNGLWFDYQCEEVTVDQADISTCSLRGLFLEASAGPIRVSDSRLTGNGDGVLLSSVSRAEFVRCVIADNRRAQISVFTDWGAGRENRRGPEGVHCFVSFEQIRFISCRFRLPSSVSKFLDAAWYDYTHAITRFARTASFDNCVLVVPGQSAAEAVPNFWLGLPRWPVDLASSAAAQEPEHVGIRRRVWSLDDTVSLADLPAATGAFARRPNFTHEVAAFRLAAHYPEPVAVQDRGFIDLDTSCVVVLSLRNADGCIMTIAPMDDPENRVLVHYGPAGEVAFPPWADGGAILEITLCLEGSGGYALSVLGPTDQTVEPDPLH